jgi:SAM-dependent MidA family methyltransferase
MIFGGGAAGKRRTASERPPGDTIIGVSSEFEAATESTALKTAITERIQREGAITFRDFMEMALYDPRLGYYCSPREKMGRAGDYLTSPEVSPVFGVMIGRQLREMWELMARPRAFDVVEAGAGSGVMARDILRWAQNYDPAFREAIRYTIIEISAGLADRQKHTLDAEDLDGYLTWTERLPDDIQGCLLSNELLDSMPVHRVVVREGALCEIFVGWDGQSFAEELRPPSTSGIADYFGHVGLLPGEGCRAEVNLAALEWMRNASAALRTGFVLTFDYGYEASDLFAPWRQDGTLLCFYRHNPSGDPYARIGKQDMTSHVDFTSLRRAVEDAGLHTLGIVSQSEFLANLGIADALSGNETPDLEDYYARRGAVMELLDTGGLGRIRVLAQSKGLQDVRLTGLTGATPSA